jgi:pimeloyl-ACP methyl ester carboxylesterase
VRVEDARILKTADGAVIAYRRWRPAASTGPRRTVVALHGLASNMTRWAEFAAATRLAESWDILRIDLRGHGDSLYRGRVGMDVWCADLAALLRQEQVSSALLVGHCLGANLALWFAHHEPTRVAGLVLIEPMFRQALVGEPGRAARLRPLIAAVVPPLRLLAALGLYRRHLVPLDLMELDREARAAMARTGGKFPEARYASIREDLRSLPLSIYLQDMLAVTGPVPGLSTISVPTLALLSQGTSFTDPEITARELALLPDGHIDRLNARHWIPTEQPEAMRRAIEDWCDQRFGH